MSIPDIDVWIESHNQKIFLHVWGTVIERPYKSSHQQPFKIGFDSGRVRLGNARVDWIGLFPRYSVPTFGTTDDTWREAIDDIWIDVPLVEFMAVEFSKLGRVLRVKHNKKFFEQPMEIGPNFYLQDSCPIGYIWPERQLLRILPKEWITPEACWSDPQYEYMAREWMINPKSF